MSLGGLTGGGLTGSGGGSIAGGVAAPSETKADASLLISYAKSEGARKEGDKPGGDASGTDIHADLTTEEQNRKLQDFAAVQGRPNFGQRQQDEQQREVRLAQASIGTMSDALPEVVGSGPGSTRIPLEDAGQAGDGALPTMGNIAKKGLKTGGPVGAAASVLLGSTNSNHDQTLTIPGHPQYRITGKEDMVGRTLEVQNADGGWEPIGTISVGGVQGGPTTVDMTEVNDVLKDRGFEPVDLGDTSLPGTPIDGPKGPSILSTPDQGGESVDILTTPNAGPRGAEVLSTPVPEEQGPQILEARNTKLDGKLKQLGLPTEGDVTFDPAKRTTEDTLLKKRGEMHGYVDKDRNEWTWDRLHNDHWDVTLSETGKRKLGHLSKSGTHINVFPDGRVR
jgi:hypothetical protein